MFINIENTRLLLRLSFKTIVKILYNNDISMIEVYFDNYDNVAKLLSIFAKN